MGKLNLVRDRKFGENISMTFDFLSNLKGIKGLVLLLIVVALGTGVVSFLGTAGMFLELVLTGLAGALVMVYVASYMKLYVDSADGTIDQSQLNAKVKKHFWVVVLAAILYGIAGTVGMFLLVIPGVYIFVVFAFFAFCIVDKEQGAIESLKESKSLVENSWWVTFGYMIVVSLLLLVVGGFFVWLGEYIRGLGSLGNAVGTFLTNSISFLVSMITYIAYGVYYYNLVDKSEGLFNTSQIDSIGKEDE